MDLEQVQFSIWVTEGYFVTLDQSISQDKMGYYVTRKRVA